MKHKIIQIVEVEGSEVRENNKKFKVQGILILKIYKYMETNKESLLQHLNQQFEYCEKIEEETWKDMRWLKEEITSQIYFLIYWEWKND